MGNHTGTDGLKVILRALEPEDIDLLYSWENDRNIWHVSNTHTPFSRYVLRKYIENSHQDIYQAKQLRLMIDIMEDNVKMKTVGAIDLFDFDPFHRRAGVGILIYGSKNQHKGYATAALQELVQYVSVHLHLHQLFCNISIDNQLSIKLFQKVGFEIAGIKKDWLKTEKGYVDEAFLQLITRN